MTAGEIVDPYQGLGQAGPMGTVDVGTSPIDVNAQVEAVKPQAQALLGSLVKQGSTGIRGLDRALVAGFQNQTAFAKGATPEEIIADAERQIPALKLERMSQLQAATEGSPLTQDQLLATAILQLAPIVLGAAVGGAQGGVVGAQSGLIGANTFTKEAAVENERERQNAFINAQVAGEQITALNKQASEAQKMGMQHTNRLSEIGAQGEFTKEAARIRAKGEIKAAERALGGAKLTAADQQRVTDTMGVIENAQRYSSELRKLPSDGTLDRVSFFGKKWAPGTKESEIVQQGKLLIAQITRSFTGAQAAVPEIERYEAIINGAAPMPLPEEMARLTDQVVDSLKRVTAVKMERALQMGTQEGTMQIIKDLRAGLPEDKKLDKQYAAIVANMPMEIDGATPQEKRQNIDSLPAGQIFVLTSKVTGQPVRFIRDGSAQGFTEYK